MSQEHTARITREALSSEFWQEVFLPTYKGLHDTLEAQAYSSHDIHRRYALIEAVRALRELKFLIDSAQTVEENTDDIASRINELEFGHPQDS